MEMSGTVVISVITRQHGNGISKHTQTLFMEMCGMVVINVITRRLGKEISKHTQTLCMEMCGTVVISVITRQNGKEISKNMYSLLMQMCGHTCDQFCFFTFLTFQRLLSHRNDGNWRPKSAVSGYCVGRSTRVTRPIQVLL